MSARRGPGSSTGADNRSVWSMLVSSRAFGGAGRRNGIESVLSFLSDALRDDERELRRLEGSLAGLRVSAAFSYDRAHEDVGRRPAADRVLKKLESRIVEEEIRQSKLSNEINFLADIAITVTNFLEARRRAG